MVWPSSCRDIVQAHQGRVLRFTGDGVKAAFGMDESREDDAKRAVRAGLAILAAGRAQAEALLRAQGVADFAVRVALHTGDVALGASLGPLVRRLDRGPCRGRRSPRS